MVAEPASTGAPSSEDQGKTTHINSDPTSGQISRSTAGPVEPDHVASEGLSAEMSNLRRDVASLKNTFARLALRVGGEMAKNRSPHEPNGRLALPQAELRMRDPIFRTQKSPD